VSEPVLEVEGVRKSFGGVHAVDGVDFVLPRGEIRALIGPNGAGKTTFFNILTGQLRADAGTVRFRGEPLGRLPPWEIWRRGIARTFQITATFATLTVRENVQVARLSHVGKSRALFTPGRRLEVDTAGRHRRDTGERSAQIVQVARANLVGGEDLHRGGTCSPGSEQFGWSQPTGHDRHRGAVGRIDERGIGDGGDQIVRAGLDRGGHLLAVGHGADSDIGVLSELSDQSGQSGNGAGCRQGEFDASDPGGNKHLEHAVIAGSLRCAHHHDELGCGSASRNLQPVPRRAGCQRVTSHGWSHLVADSPAGKRR